MSERLKKKCLNFMQWTLGTQICLRPIVHLEMNSWYYFKIYDDSDDSKCDFHSSLPLKGCRQQMIDFRNSVPDNSCPNR